MTTLEERAAKGAALLDAKRPGWAKKIDLDSLDITSCLNCVLGQLFCGFSEGARRLEMSGAWDTQVEHGFETKGLGNVPALNAAWEAEIQSRLN